MSFIPTGTVYGTLLNFRGELEALGAEDERAALQGAAEGAGALRQDRQHLERRRQRTFPCRRG